jgi:hypothetical protein
MRRHSTSPYSGKQLVADFQTAFVSIATTEAAQYEAERSENDLMDYFASLQNGTYLNPSVITNSSGFGVAKASVDAHIKKVQAQQLMSMNAQQLQSLIEQDKSNYRGRKVRVTVTSSVYTPITSVWFDARNGYRHNQTKKQVVAGTIREVLLDKNMLVLQPTRGSRLLNSGLQNYAIYIIDPETFAPMVEIALL